MNIWAIGVVRNEADIIRANVLHHHAQGVSHFLWLDNRSSDGTTDVLDDLRSLVSLEWRSHEGGFRQDVLLTALAQEAFVRGADWIVPIDADEFWYAPEGSLRQALEGTGAGALRVQVVNFVQRRERHARSADALLTMTRRTESAIGESDRAECLVDSGAAAFVEIRYPGKWIIRASPSAEISWGSHAIYGAQGPVLDTTDIVCLHAPLRSKETLERKVDDGRPHDELHEYLSEAWHVRRWRRLRAAGGLDAEWCANSYDDAGMLSLYGEPRPLVLDTRLADLVAPWLRGEGVRQSDRALPAPSVQGAGVIVFREPQRFAPRARVWGLFPTDGDTDIVGVNVLHHLSLGLERVLIADIGASRDPRAVLGLLAHDPRLEWIPWDGPPSAPRC